MPPTPRSHRHRRKEPAPRRCGRSRPTADGARPRGLAVRERHRMSADGRITYQVIGYTDVGGVSKVGQTALLRTTEEGLTRFLSGQLLMWQYARGHRRVRSWWAIPSSCAEVAAQVCWRRGCGHPSITTTRSPTSTPTPAPSNGRPTHPPTSSSPNTHIVTTVWSNCRSGDGDAARHAQSTTTAAALTTSDRCQPTTPSGEPVPTGVGTESGPVAATVAWYRFDGDVGVALLVVGGSGGLRCA
jgi:hypothetical protein